MKDNCTDDVIVHLPDDGGKENPINLNGQDEGEVEEQGGCVPQQHLQRFGQGHVWLRTQYDSPIGCSANNFFLSSTPVPRYVMRIGIESSQIFFSVIDP